MSNFDLLHPALQHHIVNSLGWRELRPFQDKVIPSVLAGEHLIVLAPTAGGKTESAFFPLVSRMLTEGWLGLSILYLCPIKALLNNLDTRLERYCSLLGRRSTLWHGDVGQSARRKIQQEPPDCLLTTPESLEVMLDSASVDSVRLLSNLRAVVVDEIHAFAGDDRGWHLLSVLGRASRLAGREIQRIGLSATVGNPEHMLEWLAGSCTRPQRCFVPAESKAVDSDVKLDFVGSLSNAAIVISRLHRGEKRLVFIDSRARAEQLAAQLRELEVSAFVTHSSLSQEQRHQAEHAFANRDNCVIIATSVLELGIDVGDLDRVIQIDSPATVSSFLQRMGRTGRRPGTTRNCLFLATEDETLIQAAALVDLWSRGYVEPVQPPPAPYHIFAQQVMALVLQQRGIPRDEISRWLEGVSTFSEMSNERRDEILTWMLEHGILSLDGGVLSFGSEGEKLFGRKNFLEIFSVFLSPPLFSILHGRQELGFVDELTFLGKKEGPRVLLLGGRAWIVKHVDWQRKLAYVESTDAKGRSRWKGEGPGLGFEICQSVQAVLATEDERDYWSQRANERIAKVRSEYAWLGQGESVVVNGSDGLPEWWTFAGFAANAMLAGELSRLLQSQVQFDNFTLTFRASVSTDSISRAVTQLREMDPTSMQPVIDERAILSLKFAECLPPKIILECLMKRLMQVDAVRKLLEKRTSVVAISV